LEADVTRGVQPLELDFGVRGAAPVPYAAVPMLGFELEITTRSELEVKTVSLQVQVQISARRRSYATEEQARLLELFGETHRWSETLRSLLWLRTTQVVPGFTAATVVELQVPCTYDFDVTAAKYLAALREGEVPLELLFSGTVFYKAENGLLQTAMIGWDREAEYRMPVSIWREAMDTYFPNSTWLRLQRESFERLHAYRARHALTGWEQAIDRLLEADR
jgi:uncharacterized protein DUF6084